MYASGSIYDLNDYIILDSDWEITNAFDINSNAQIAAYGCSDTFGCQALLLNPVVEVSAVPEPAGIAMWLAGLALFGWTARRRIG